MRHCPFNNVIILDMPAGLKYNKLLRNILVQKVLRCNEIRKSIHLQLMLLAEYGDHLGSHGDHLGSHGAL